MGTTENWEQPKIWNNNMKIFLKTTSLCRSHHPSELTHFNRYFENNSCIPCENVSIQTYSNAHQHCNLYMHWNLSFKAGKMGCVRARDMILVSQSIYSYSSREIQWCIYKNPKTTQSHIHTNIHVSLRLFKDFYRYTVEFPGLNTYS